tara:strand:- start:508 stop:657 length:150 start_codon:yes stop_codon:yes gene_type:complete
MKWLKKETNQDKIEFYLNVLLALSKNTKLSSYEKNKYVKILNNVAENIS